MNLKEVKHMLNDLVIGREKEMDFMLIALIQGGHVLLESAPGSGKTWMAKVFASIFGSDFNRIQFTPDVLPSDVTGLRYYNPKSEEFVLRPGPVLTHFLLADEINRATPRTQSSLLESMEEKQVTIDGETLKLPEPFFVMATQNPIESQQGTFPLPAAQLDRFLFKLEIGYPSMEEELRILREFRAGARADQKLEPVATLENIWEWASQVKKINIHEDVEHYILALIRASRDHESVEIGLSSRAALAMVNAAQGRAFLEGRTFVVPDDVKYIAGPVCQHRLLLTPEASLVTDAQKVVHELLSAVPAPVEVT